MISFENKNEELRFGSLQVSNKDRIKADYYLNDLVVNIKAINSSLENLTTSQVLTSVLNFQSLIEFEFNKHLLRLSNEKNLFVSERIHVQSFEESKLDSDSSKQQLLVDYQLLIEKLYADFDSSAGSLRYQDYQEVLTRLDSQGQSYITYTGFDGHSRIPIFEKNIASSLLKSDYSDPRHYGQLRKKLFELSGNRQTHENSTPTMVHDSIKFRKSIFLLAGLSFSKEQELSQMFLLLDQVYDLYWDSIRRGVIYQPEVQTKIAISLICLNPANQEDEHAVMGMNRKGSTLANIKFVGTKNFLMTQKHHMTSPNKAMFSELYEMVNAQRDLFNQANDVFSLLDNRAFS